MEHEELAAALLASLGLPRHSGTQDTVKPSEPRAERNASDTEVEDEEDEEEEERPTQGTQPNETPSQRQKRKSHATENSPVDLRQWPELAEPMRRFAETIYVYSAPDEDRILFVIGHLNQELFRVSRAKFARDFLGKETRKTSLEYIPKKLLDARVTNNTIVLSAYEALLAAVKQHCKVPFQPPRRVVSFGRKGSRARVLLENLLMRDALSQQSVPQSQSAPQLSPGPAQNPPAPAPTASPRAEKKRKMTSPEIAEEPAAKRARELYLSPQEPVQASPAVPPPSTASPSAQRALEPDPERIRDLQAQIKQQMRDRQNALAPGPEAPAPPPEQAKQAETAVQHPQTLPAQAFAMLRSFFFTS